MIIQICVGSACHLKGSQELVDLFQKAVADHHLDMDVTLTGSFCTGQCNRVGVTIIVDGVTHTGITPEGFDAFFSEYVLKPLGK